jgi:segregation and condensation protein A
VSEPTPGQGTNDAYRVQVESFEGPLDLLLHLVRINEVDIADIPIVAITAQYNEYLEWMRDLNLEVAGEYLVMAASLMHIKSQMLLPPDPDTLEEDAQDPRAELAQQLLEYQRFRQAAENLQAMESRRGLIWTRRDVPDEFADEELLAVDMYDLLQAFQQLVGRLGEEAQLHLKRDNVSVADKMGWLEGLLAERRSVDLLRLLAELPSQLERIATFLAVLEMMRLAQVIVFQRKLFGEIRVALPPDPEDQRGAERGTEERSGE